MSDTDDRLRGLDRIVARYGDDFVAYQPESHRIVTVVYTAMGIIGAGGFRARPQTTAGNAATLRAEKLASRGQANSA